MNQDDWYLIQESRIMEFDRLGIIKRKFEGSPAKALRASYPNINWHPWLFGGCPTIWDDEGTKSQYATWLSKVIQIQCMLIESYAKILQLDSMEDWYDVRACDIEEKCGATLMNKYGGRVSSFVIDVFPEYNWHAWLFEEVPLGYWNNTNYHGYAKYSAPRSIYVLFLLVNISNG
jgi:hypothetical protein